MDNTTTAIQELGELLKTPENAAIIPPRRWPIQVYLNDGRVFEYFVESEHKVREHSDAIVSRGYRHCEQDGTYEHFPPHRIEKVKSVGISSKYYDTVRGT